MPFRIGMIVFGLFVFAGMAVLPAPEDLSPEAQRVAAVAVLMGIWWMTEAAPLAATALVPIALFPLLGVMPGSSVTACYGEPAIFLFAGGFFIAMTMERWGLHRRLALSIILRTGVSHKRLLLGFMLATAFLSMWISNSATAMMMYPIGLAVIGQLEISLGRENASRMAVALLLSIAYAANIGGLGTLIGTPTNLVLNAQMHSLFPDAPPIHFAQWMLIGVPLAGLYLAFTWWLLAFVLYRPPTIETMGGVRDQLADQARKLGPMSRGERWTAGIAVAAALAWIFRVDIDLGGVVVPGWSRLMPADDFVDDTTVAILFATLLFLIPIDLDKREFLLDWKTAVKIPWGVLLLFGGGLAVAKGCSDTGLIKWIGTRLDVLGEMPPVVMIAMIAALAALISEFASNTATATILLPVMAVTAVDVLHIHPLYLMVPATIGASCAFMLPVGTPPNAIVFGSGHLSIRDMMKAGLLVDLAGVVLVTLVVYVLLGRVVGADLASVPAWAGGE